MIHRTVRCSIVLVALTLCLALAAGCKKKPPVTPAEAPRVATTTVAPPPAASLEPTPEPDQVEEIWSQELEAINRHVREMDLLGDVYYDFDRSDLRSEARERLARNAEFLRQRPEFVVTVEGHCDERGTSEYNLALGERRGHSATGYVKSLGVDGGRLSTVSYGKERPQCTESDEGCWQRNRRAHFVISGRVQP